MFTWILDPFGDLYEELPGGCLYSRNARIAAFMEFCSGPINSIAKSHIYVRLSETAQCLFLYVKALANTSRTVSPELVKLQMN